MTAPPSVLRARHPSPGSAGRNAASATALTKNVPSAAGSVKVSLIRPAHAITTADAVKNALTTAAPTRTPTASAQPTRTPTTDAATTATAAVTAAPRRRKDRSQPGLSWAGRFPGLVIGLLLGRRGYATGSGSGWRAPSGPRGRSGERPGCVPAARRPRRPGPPGPRAGPGDSVPPRRRSPAAPR